MDARTGSELRNVVVTIHVHRDGGRVVVGVGAAASPGRVSYYEVDRAIGVGLIQDSLADILLAAEHWDSNGGRHESDRATG